MSDESIYVDSRRMFWVVPLTIAASVIAVLAVREVAIRVRVGSGEEPGEIPIVPDEIGNEAARFHGHRDGSVWSEVGKRSALTRGRQDAIETKPLLNELIEGFARLGVIEHAAGGLFDTLGRVEFAARGSGEEGVVGHGIEQRVRQA